MIKIRLMTINNVSFVERLDKQNLKRCDSLRILTVYMFCLPDEITLWQKLHNGRLDHSDEIAPLDIKGQCHYNLIWIAGIQWFVLYTEDVLNKTIAQAYIIRSYILISLLILNTKYI